MSKEPYHVIIPPSTSSIQAMIDAESMSLKKAVAELIANAIDQDAKNINIDLDRKKKQFIISDDGDGPPKNLESMMEIGTHISSKADPIGRFGVGFKDAVIWLGDFVMVDSLTKSGQLRLPIGDLGTADEIKISKALLYFFENVDFDESGNATVAA